jgi:hypothetical protein
VYVIDQGLLWHRAARYSAHPQALLAFLTALEDTQKEIPLSEDAEKAAQAINVYSQPANGM